MIEKLLQSWVTRQIFKLLALLPAGSAAVNPEEVGTTGALVATVVMLGVEAIWSKASDRLKRDELDDARGEI